MNGREMKKRLEDAGIRPQKVVRKRETDIYIADFFAPEMQSSVPSALSRAQEIKQRFSAQVQIIQVDDLRADWREGQPIISATVTFSYRDLLPEGAKQ